MIDRAALIEHYRRMPDESFTHLATHLGEGLEPEAIELIRQELHVRGTVPDADAAIDIQLRRPSSEEFEVLVTAFRKLPCPKCGSTSEPLNGAEIKRGSNVDLEAACPTCLKADLKFASNAGALGALFAEWRHVSDVTKNTSMLKALESGEQTEALRLYLWRNRGEWAHLLRG